MWFYTTLSATIKKKNNNNNNAIQWRLPQHFQIFLFFFLHHIFSNSGTKKVCTMYFDAWNVLFWTNIHSCYSWNCTHHPFMQPISSSWIWKTLMKAKCWTTFVFIHEFSTFFSFLPNRWNIQKIYERKNNDVLFLKMKIIIWLIQISTA